MERCPNCRARTGDGPVCRRCGMDLTLLQAVERASELGLRRALAALAAGDAETAVRLVRQAGTLRHTAFAQQLTAFIERAGDDDRAKPTLVSEAALRSGAQSTGAVGEGLGTSAKDSFTAAGRL